MVSPFTYALPSIRCTEILIRYARLRSGMNLLGSEYGVLIGNSQGRTRRVGQFTCSLQATGAHLRCHHAHGHPHALPPRFRHLRWVRYLLFFSGDSDQLWHASPSYRMYLVQDLLIIFPLSFFILYPNAAPKLADRRYPLSCSFLNPGDDAERKFPLFFLFLLPGLQLV